MPHRTFNFSPYIRGLCQGEVVGGPSECGGVEGQINQVQLSLLAAVSPATVSRWASGAASPAVEDLIRMRDCQRLPHWFRQACKSATAQGHAPCTDERSDLDADGDGRITVRDAEYFDAEKQTVAARRHLRLEQEVTAGHLSPDDLAEQLSLESQEEKLSRQSGRVLEIVSRHHGRPVAV